MDSIQPKHTMSTLTVGTVLWVFSVDLRGKRTGQGPTGPWVVVQEIQELCLDPLLHLQWENSAWLGAQLRSLCKGNKQSSEAKEEATFMFHAHCLCFNLLQQ